jgi:hypothetical protein
MRKIHESDIQPSTPKSVYLFIAISVAFAFFSLIAGLLLIANFLSILDLPMIKSMDSIYWAPLISSGIGFIYGIVAKAKIQEHVAVSEQGCLADILIYSNLLIFVVYIFSSFVLAYLFRFLD